MTHCPTSCPAGWLWMAGLGGVFIGLTIAAVQREMDRRRRPPEDQSPRP